MKVLLKPEIQFSHITTRYVLQPGRLLPSPYTDLKARTMRPLRHLTIAATLAALDLPVYAVLPPAYLSVPDFKQCLSEHNEGSYSSWCQPAKKPKACPRISWRQLRALQGNDAVPACRAK